MTLTPKVKLIGAISGLSVAAVILAVQFLFGGKDASDFANTIVVIDADSGEVVKGFVPPEGKMAPWSEGSHKRLYPTERCFYTKDGKVKSEPTYVLVNELIGKEGPTKCPDCGRPVTLRNRSPKIEEIEQARKDGR